MGHSVHRENIEKHKHKRCLILLLCISSVISTNKIIHTHKRPHIKKSMMGQLKYRLWVHGCKFWERIFCVWTFQYCPRSEAFSSYKFPSWPPVSKTFAFVFANKCQSSTNSTASSVTIGNFLKVRFWAIIGFTRRDLWGEMTQLQWWYSQTNCWLTNCDLNGGGAAPSVFNNT